LTSACGFSHRGSTPLGGNIAGWKQPAFSCAEVHSGPWKSRMVHLLSIHPVPFKPVYQRTAQGSSLPKDRIVSGSPAMC
jgi:hypothetical protein